jgi:hypothetical protein
MSFNIPPTLQSLDLGDWNPAAKGQKIHVWVDPPRVVLQERTAFRQEYDQFLESLVRPVAQQTPQSTDEAAEMERQKSRIDEDKQKTDAFLATWNPKRQAFFEKIWARGPVSDKDFHPTVAEMEQLEQDNPQLLHWLFNRSSELIDNYHGAEKKE